MSTDFELRSGDQTASEFVLVRLRGGERSVMMAEGERRGELLTGRNPYAVDLALRAVANGGAVLVAPGRVAGAGYLLPQGAPAARLIRNWKVDCSESK